MDGKMENQSVLEDSIFMDAASHKKPWLSALLQSLVDSVEQ